MFTDFVAAELGTRNWVVAGRATPRLRERYDAIITPRRFAEIKSRFGF